MKMKTIQSYRYKLLMLLRNKPTVFNTMLINVVNHLEANERIEAWWHKEERFKLSLQSEIVE